MTLTWTTPVRLIHTPLYGAPVMVCPAQSSVTKLALIVSPFPSQGPMSALSVVDEVMVEPHPIAALAGAGEKTSVEPKTVKRSMTTSGSLPDLLLFKNHALD